MQHLLIPVLALLFSGLVQDARAETPNDIKILRQVITLSENITTNRSALATLLHDETLNRVESISRDRDYPRWFNKDNPHIVKVVKRTIKSELSNPRTDKKALFELAISVVNGTLAEEAMAETIGAPPPPAFTSKRKARRRTLADGYVKVNGGGALRADLSSSTLQNDRGGIGSGNGVLDPGEMVELSLVFENTSTTRLMSTSIYAKSSSECVWVMSDPKKEYQLAEMDPGETSSLKLRIFFSGQCGSREGWFQLTAYDSQKFARDPIRLRYTFPAGTRSSAGAANQSQLINYDLDVDDYGHSEPTKRQPLRPDTQVELRAGLSIKGDTLSSAYQQFIVPKPLTASHKAASVKTRGTASAMTASYADDVDIWIPEKQPLLQGLTAHAERLDWSTKTDARLFVSVDSLLTANQENATTPEETPDESVQFNMKAVEKALAKHLTVTPVITDGGTPTGMALMTVHGFRISVAEPSILLGELTAAQQSGTNAQQSGTELPRPTNATDALAYQVRHYIELPVYWEPKPLICQVNSPKSVKVGDPINLTAMATDIPPEATAWITVDGQPFQKAKLKSSSNRIKFVEASMSTSKVGVRLFQFEVRQGEKVLCSESAKIPVLIPAHPTCSLAAPTSVRLGDPVDIRVKTQYTPPTATGWLQINGKGFKEVKLTRQAGTATLRQRISTSKTGDQRFRFELREGDDVACRASDTTEVSDPFVVRKWSLEVGRMTHQAGTTADCLDAGAPDNLCDMTGGGLTGSYGFGDRNNHRLAFGMEYTSNIYGGQSALAALTPWAGYRHTFLLPAEAGTPLYIEISPQLALAAPMYAGLSNGSVIALRPSLRVALHGLIGPYAELGRIALPSYMTSSNFLNVGVGLYWPKN